MLGEKAPIQLVNANSNFSGLNLDQRVTSMFDPTGLQLADPVGHPAVAQTVILDYSNGKFPLTAKWLANYFGAPASGATPTVPAPASGQQTYGLVVLIGNDFEHRWLGQ